MSNVTKASRGAGKRISRALQDLLDEARAAGCEEPSLFFESESGAVFVFDRKHPEYEARDRKQSAMARQSAVVLEAPIRTPFDTGAW